MEEVDSTLHGAKDITFEHLSQLTYMSQVIKETLRLYPPASATAREPLTDIMLNGYRIPKGTFMAVRHSLIHI